MEHGNELFISRIETKGTHHWHSHNTCAGAGGGGGGGEEDICNP